MVSILLDTSFCIRLLKEDDPLHQNAVDYFKYFLEHKIELYLSTIVVAEYSVKDSIENLPLQMMKIIPFDFEDARTAGKFHDAILQSHRQPSTLGKDRIKDDCKLIAQLYNRNISGYITKDRSSFNQIIAPIVKAHPFQLTVIDLANPLSTFTGELF